MFVISEKFIRKIMQKYDVILPRPYFWKITVYEKYFKGGHGKEKDLIVLRNIIQNDYNEYLEDYDFIVNSNCSSYCNSYIMNEQNINLYFTWLFDILKKVENRINITNYNNKEKRVFGYLSEILINVWVRHKKLKVKYISLNQINTNFWSKIKNELKIYRKKY